MTIRAILSLSASLSGQYNTPTRYLMGMIGWLLYAAGGHAQDFKVEPPNWWINMPQSQVELMIHAPYVGSAEVKIERSDVKIVKVETAESENYLFVTIDISHVREEGKLPIHLSSSMLDTIVGYPIHERSAQWKPMGFDASDIIYLITPDRFANANHKNDTHPTMKEEKALSDLFGRHGGDIAGIQSYVPYIDSMGFTAVWSSPLMENNQERSSYHGYSVTDLYSIDPRMGSMEEYKDLSKALHNRGLKLIMDYIPNHIGSGHWWMNDLPFQDWINYNGSFHPTNHNRNTLHDPYASAYDKQAFTDGWFVESMPDLNQRNAHLSTYLIQNTLWWIETAELDGLRVDTYPYSDKDFLNNWSCAVMESYPSLGMVGEEWTTNPNYIAYWQHGNQRNPSTCLPGLFDFPLQAALVASLMEEEAWNSGWVKLQETLSADYLYPHPNGLVTFLDNHDMDRYFKQVGEDLRLYKIGLGLLMTLRGIPQVYYGTEILLSNDLAGNHGDIRSHMPGTWATDSSDARKAASLDPEAREAQAWMKKLNELRTESKVLQKGDMIQFSPKNAVYSYIRTYKDQHMLVLANKGDQDTKVDGQMYHEYLDLKRTWRDCLTNATFPMETDIRVPAKSILILADH